MRVATESCGNTNSLCVDVSEISVSMMYGYEGCLWL